MNLEDPQERVANAGEYVLGTLTPDDKQAFEARVATDRDLKAEVYAWQDHLLSLNERVSPMAVKDDLWPRLLLRLGALPGLPAAGAQATGQPGAANDPLWRRLGFWRATSAFAVAASLVMATMLISTRLAGTGPAPARYLAVLQSPDKSTGWVVEMAEGESVRLVPVGSTPPVPEGKSLQFWTKPQGAKGPTSLGLVKAGQTYVLPVSRLPGLGEQQLFELTLEPATGSPTGKPTGPVLFVGRTVRL